MPDTKISADPAVTSLSGSEKAPCVQGGLNKTFTPAQVDSYIRGAGLTAELGAKATASYVDAAVTIMADNAKTGNFTFALVDGATSKITRSNSASAVTGTVPANSAVPFPTGQFLNLVRGGAGAFNIAAGSGVTISRPSDRSLSLRAQYSGATLWKIGTDSWILTGDLT